MATVVLLDVLRANGFRDAHPITVKYKVLNPKFTERLNTQPFPQTPEQIALWQADGCAMVAITDEQDSETHWAGHLIAVIPKGLKGKDAICDLTIPQANVPAWNIKLGSVVAGIRDSFKDGSEDIAVSHRRASANAVSQAGTGKYAPGHIPTTILPPRKPLTAAPNFRAASTPRR